MKETGPDATPPFERTSCEARILERFAPEPPPFLKIFASVAANPMIESIVSSTDEMKHAEHCGRSSTPTLSQTGVLKESDCEARR